MTDYVHYNQERWNRVSARQGNAYTVPLSHEEFLLAKDKPLSVSLTVGKTVPLDWFEKAQGKKLLGLACGGGQQGPMFAAHGYKRPLWTSPRNSWTRIAWLRSEKIWICKRSRRI